MHDSALKVQHQLVRSCGLTNLHACSIHVASVVQVTHMVLTRGGVMKSNAMTRLQQLATYIAAVIHDFQHGGVNNDFLIKTFHPLAMTYNDISPLENHHLASAAMLLHQPEHMFMPVSWPPTHACYHASHVLIGSPFLYAFHRAALHDHHAHILVSTVTCNHLCTGDKQCYRLWLCPCCRTAGRLSPCKCAPSSIVTVSLG